MALKYQADAEAVVMRSSLSVRANNMFNVRTLTMDVRSVVEVVDWCCGSSLETDYECPVVADCRR